ncbi:phosphate ABC transporter substrate-binding/OmpA family protein [Aliiruegeria lutimaris]|nr:phosphate ABC transporter substrate-binding/OmpA family protein [Aliiruegeria lutimaris]
MAPMLSRAAAIAALLLFGAAPVAAQDAFLTSRDGGISLEGTMLGFDGEFYRLRTEFGVITIDAEGVDCEGPGCPDLLSPIADIRLSGDASLGQILLPAMVETFAATNAFLPKRVQETEERFSYHLIDPTQDRLVARFHFDLSDTAQGLNDLMEDRADLAMANRAATADEIARGQAAGIGDLSGPRRSRIVALDALVAVVASRNPVRRISLEQLAGIRSGKIQSWSELGGTPNAIDLHEMVPDGTTEQFFPEGGAKGAESERSGWLLRHESSPGLVDTVARNPEALGLVRYSKMDHARPLVLTGSCGRQISVSPEAIKAEDYPLPLPLYLYVPPRRLPLLGREFLDWLNTPSAEMAVRRAGYVDQVPVEIPVAAQGERLANAISAAGDEVSLEDLQELVTAMSGARRLTATFRFRNGSANLDAQSEGNLDRLARDIEIGLHDGNEIILAGFSDGLGPADANRALSLERAQTVSDALRAIIPAADWERVRLTAIGMGEALPLACDDNERGRQTNRRVEVWLR